MQDEGEVSDVGGVLANVRTVVVIDWPSREVPDTLARRGFSVVSHDGPGEADYNAYEVDGDSVRVRAVGRRPERADLVYAHRPIDELPGIVEAAKEMGAKAVWIQSGRDATGARDPRGCWLSEEDGRRARNVVEGGGLTYVDSPYIVDAVRDWSGSWTQT